MNKILIFTESLGVDGPERVIANLANNWSSNSFEIHIYLTRFNPKRATFPINSTVKVTILNQKKGRFLKLSRVKEILLIRRVLSENIGSPCVSFMNSTSFSLSIASLFKKNKIILSERNDPNSVPFTSFQRKMRNLAFHLADACVFQTEDAKNYFNEEIKKKSAIILNPVSPDLPKPYSGEREKKIVAVGRLSPQKNFPMLIKAFCLLHKVFPEYSLVIYGEGQDRDILQKIVDDFNLKDSVFMPGFSKNVYRDILKASLFVSSSNYEGISNSMIEAMCLGLPVVCTDCPSGGAKMLIKDGVNGFLVPVNNEKELFERIKKVIENPSSFKQLTFEATALRNTLSIETIAKKWLDIIFDNSNFSD